MCRHTSWVVEHPFCELPVPYQHERTIICSVTLEFVVAARGNLYWWTNPRRLSHLALFYKGVPGETTLSLSLSLVAFLPSCFSSLTNVFPRPLQWPRCRWKRLRKVKFRFEELVTMGIGRWAGLAPPPCAPDSPTQGAPRRLGEHRGRRGRCSRCCLGRVRGLACWCAGCEYRYSRGLSGIRTTRRLV